MRLGVVLLLVACTQVVRPEVREAPVEAGVPVTFTDSAPLTWDFGDATPRVTGASVSHAFGHVGRFVVQAYDGQTLVRRMTTVVEPRPAFHSVPATATSLVIARNADDLAPAVDLGERVVGAGTMQRWLDELPLLAFVLDQGSGRSSLVEARGGLGVFSLPTPDVSVSFIAVSDTARALKLFAPWLIDHGWEGGPEVFTHDGRQPEVFVDRGVLYAALGDLGAPTALPSIASGSALGLQSSPPIADVLNDVPSGGWVIFTKSGDPSAQWSTFAGAVALTELEARFSGRVLAKAPLWQSPPAPPGRLLEHAPDGPIAAASLSVPPKTLASLVFGNPGTVRRERLARDFGSDVEQAFDSLSGVVDAAAYFDAESFFRSTVENEGRPTARGTLLIEAAVRNALFFGQFLEAVLLQNGFRTSRAQDKTLNVWRFRVFDEPVEVALTASTLFVKGGEPVKGRPGTDLVSKWGKSFDGAFAPGHVSLLIDLGQLRRELMAPRFIEGLDPRRVVTAQAIAQTLLDRLTQLDVVLVDVAPDARGASVQAVVRARPREKSE